ncbi:Rieske (2Fe-2S) protein [Halioxenophilus sp. WMMB6]|uniref:Rieske (2Fe-2S) protein n=1 Tax=Halioxenophilus sp. WMMB6 TaxID=3073815 RepID=UPI00295EB67D|nr:Rieske 2Fe-2S domain-containing protein [Halioxenophilus sp. WMMB6]
MASEFTRFCALSDLPLGGKKPGKVEGKIVLVVHTKDARLFAVSGMCSHQAKPILAGKVRNCTITCPTHGARFNLETGEPLDLPATSPIETYEVRVVDDWVEVSTSPRAE